jgi:hypothetical protein
MSKIPPQLRQSLLTLLQTAAAFAFRHLSTTSKPLEYFLAGTQHFVQRFLKVGRALRELLPYLRNILLEALFDLLPKELLESSVAKSFGVLRRMVGDDVGHERASESLRPLVRILGEKRVEGTSCATITRCGRR